MKLFYILTFFSTQVLASAEHAQHSAGVWSLIPPYANVILVFGFLLWKLSKPMSNAFKNKAIKIEETCVSADKKFKEAEERLHYMQLKLKNSDKESQEILAKAENEVQVFVTEAQKESEKKYQDIKNNVQRRLLSEKEVQVKNLSQELLDEVVRNAKELVATQKNNSGVMSDKLLKRMTQ
ncbi:MAG: ATP synthase F0 subunit B [Bacteriovoracaceae bacterium]|nr:ATP synthase F0 subunit B [Bacteriovoracaceae bacterium]